MAWLTARTPVNVKSSAMMPAPAGCVELDYAHRSPVPVADGRGAALTGCGKPAFARLLKKSRCQAARHRPSERTPGTRRAPEERHRRWAFFSSLLGRGLPPSQLFTCVRYVATICSARDAGRRLGQDVEHGPIRIRIQDRPIRSPADLHAVHQLDVARASSPRSGCASRRPFAPRGRAPDRGSWRAGGRAGSPGAASAR